MHKPATRNLYPAHSQLYIGDGRMLYCGPLQQLESHVYGADVLHVGIYRPFRIMLADGEWRRCRCATVPAGIPHALDMAGGVHGKLFVERDCPEASAFRTRFPHNAGAVAFFRDPEVTECFSWIHEENPDPLDLERCVRRLLSSGNQQPLEIDSRVRQAMELLRREPHRNFSQDELAGMVGLSGSRLLHLFRQHAGVPYRRLRTWKRMVSAVELLHDTDNMTRAALDAGFADSTHFSHSFRHTFGVNPGPVFRRIGRFEVGC